MSREFVDLFNDWAQTYDQTVSEDGDIEYREVFESYEEILLSVVQNTKGPNVLEFGVGTGNLTRKLVNRGYNVYGIEPSEEMLKIGQLKVPEAKIKDGDFLNFQVPEEQITSIVSSYAFHHLTDQDKETAIKKYSRLLPEGGVIVFADTVFKDKAARRAIMEQAIASYHNNLVNDLNSEHYSYLEVLRVMCEKHGFTVEFFQKNKYVWIMTATKK
ncbi:class I SAM-dependent methyltransferase [Bacillus sp. SCS-153A]|uniref:class I SAM-dependent methyltransferase n=1 Tax=Rossellomorea sedimentorum TaxID=3115294 RepID=UPI003905E175